MSKKLIFVYNADSGFFNSISDSLHKLISPSTYSCNLCALTHHHFGAKDEWKQFLQQINFPMEFLHKDEFIKQYGNASAFNFPCIIQNEAGINSLVVNSAELNTYLVLSELKDKITQIISI